MATSHAAAASMRQHAPTHHAKIVRVLKRWGPMTYEQIARRLRWVPVVAGRRLAELRELGRIKRLPETRPTESGRRAHLHQARTP